MEAAEGGEHPSFSKAQQQYSEMKRLHTSKGTRVTKYKPSREGESGKLNNNSTHESIPERKNVTSPPRTAAPAAAGSGADGNLERPPATAPSSEMQKVLRSKKYDQHKYSVVKEML